LRILAEALGAARKYDPARLKSEAVRWGDTELLHYLGGFFSGEGCFGLTDRQARIVIRTRRDDRLLLSAFAEGLGLGSVCDVRANPPLSPVAVWHVTGARQMGRVVEVLDACSLRGRKLRQYRAWRPAALEIAAASFAGRPRDLALIAEARDALRSVSKYVPEPWITQPLPTDDNVHEAYVGLLQKWAATTSGRLSGTAYNKERHPFWPTRNTIATAFGSWAAALAAADLR
jgi:hypothetical protein